MNNGGYIKTIIIILIFISLGIYTCAASSESGSKGSNAPWRELGVSKSQYEDVYNRIKYGS